MFVHFFYSGLRAQNTGVQLPEIIPPSPQAAQFMRYGEIPVGHTTGVPKIDLPIYTLSTGWMDIPISLSYHASGFRVSEIASSVGLGWVLNAGGWFISRSIEVVPDFEGRYDYMPITRAEQIDSLKNGTKKFFYMPGNYWIDFSEHQNWGNWNEYFFKSNNFNTPLFDTRSDRYFYSYPEGSGVARFNVETKELLPIPYNPIKIERLSVNSYRVTDTKGIRYEYTEPDTVAVSDKGQVVNAWYLTKIVHPNMENNPIIFTYIKGPEYYQRSRNRTISIVDARLIGSYIGNSVGVPESDVYTSVLNDATACRSPLIKTISWKNTTVIFNYSMDRLDIRKERLSSITVMSNNVTMKNILLDNSAYFGDSNKNYRLKLNGFTVNDVNLDSTDQQYTFNYYNEDATPPSYYHFEESITCSEDHWGYYNGKKSIFSFPKSIDWKRAIGIAEGDLAYFGPFRSLNQYINSGLYSADRYPSEDFTKYYVLKEIIYPTKGKTSFEYEINKVPRGYEFSANNEVGGLRVKKITDYSDENTIAKIKQFIYEGYATEQVKNNYYAYRTLYIDYCASLYATNPDRYLFYPIEYPVYIFGGNSASNLLGWTGSNVFYYKVTEYITESNGFNGSTLYNYMEENRNLNNECSYNIDEYLPSMISKVFDCDKGNINSLLISSVFFNGVGDTVRKIENDYQKYEIIPVHTGVKVWQNAIYPTNWFYNTSGYSFQRRLDISVGRQQSEYEEFYKNRIYAINTYAHRDISLLSSVKETEYIDKKASLLKKIEYSYDLKNGLPILFASSSQKQINSDGSVSQQYKKYPYDDKYKNLYPYNEMVSKNMLSFAVEEISIKNGKESKVQTSYIKDASRTKNLILPDKKCTSFSGDHNLRNDIVYDSYDEYGNILQLTTLDGVSTVYIWSYNSVYPIFEARNALYSDVKNAMGYTDAQLNNLASQSTPSSTLILQLGNLLRNNLPNAFVTTCIYKPLVGILSKVAPDGKLTYYEYDNYNRLSCIKNHDMKVIERYNYNYKP